MMIEKRFPAEGQLVTAVAVKDGNPKVLTGKTLLSKTHGVVVRFEPEDAKSLPGRGQTITLLYDGGARVWRLRTLVAEVIDQTRLLLDPTGPVTEGERREFLRAVADVPISATLVGPDYVLPGEDAPPAPTSPPQSVDISGSGLKFLWDSLCKKGDLLFVQLGLPAPGPTVASAIGEVVRAVHDPESGKLDVAVHFTAIDEPDRDRMINFVFKKYYQQLGSSLGAELSSEAG